MTTCPSVPPSQVAEVGSGAGFPLQFQGKAGETYPFLKVSDMNLPGNEEQIRSWNHSVSEQVRASLRAKAFPAGSIIFPKIGAAIATNKERLLTIPSCVGNNVMAVMPRTNNLLSEFLLLLFKTKNLSDFASDSNPPSTRKGAVENWVIPLPPLDKQRRIVDLLERAAGIRRLREQALAKARAIVPALFLDMFGDPATNPKGWPVVGLGDLAEVQGGLQVSTKRASLPLTRPYLRVANVLRDRLDLSEIKKIQLTPAEFDRTMLGAGDLLVVEGHGNPLEIGRVAIWDGTVPGCVHQNHLIRVRVNQSQLRPEYACALTNSSSGRQSLLRSGKTTSGLNTISTANVKTVPVPLPPARTQADFAARLADLRSIIAQQERSLAAARALERSLMARLLG
jgi:type I restriction enzyme, S subunit